MSTEKFKYFKERGAAARPLAPGQRADSPLESLFISVEKQALAQLNNADIKVLNY
jgi:hypothetical protein